MPYMTGRYPQQTPHEWGSGWCDYERLPDPYTVYGKGGNQMEPMTDPAVLRKRDGGFDNKPVLIQDTYKVMEAA